MIEHERGRHFPCVVLVFAATLLGTAAVRAETPYTLLGLHTGLSLTEAVEQGGQLGGDCEEIHYMETAREYVSRCSFAPCEEAEDPKTCKAPTIADQRVAMVGAKSPSAAGPVSQVFIMFDGDPYPIIDYLSALYGEPNIFGDSPDKSWSHARRMNWREGRYHVGFITRSNIITLNVDAQ